MLRGWLMQCYVYVCVIVCVCHVLTVRAVKEYDAGPSSKCTPM